MYMEKLVARSKPIPRVLVETAGKNAQSGRFLDNGRPTIWLRCRSWRSDCDQKNGDVDLATSLSSRSLETLNVATRTSDNPRACGLVNTEGSTVGRQSYGVDLASFENLAQAESLGLNEQAHVSNLLSRHDSSNN